MAGFVNEFEWDPVKAEANRKKHGVDFARAAEVFRDPLALTILDEEHGADEVRWITLGKDTSGSYVLVIHTYEETSAESARIRVISARAPSRAEIRAYEKET